MPVEIGIMLLVVGAILGIFALAGALPGKKKFGGALAALILVAGAVLAAPLFAGLMEITPAVPTGAQYEVRWTDSAPVDTAGSGGTDLATSSIIVDPLFKNVDILANSTDYQAWSVTDVEFQVTVSRIDAGDADDQQTVYFDMGTVDVITDVSAGTTYTLLDYDDTTESYDAIWATSASGFTIALQSGNRYYTSMSPGDVIDITVDIDPNEAAFAAAVVGDSYGFTLVAAGQVLSVEMIVTAA